MSPRVPKKKRSLLTADAIKWKARALVAEQHLKMLLQRQAKLDAQESLDADPQAEEKRTRSWPKSFSPVANFADADRIESQLAAEGFETVRINWGGQFFEIRARPQRKLGGAR